MSMEIEAKKIADVDFNIVTDKEVKDIRFIWKKGKLYISVSSILVNSKNVWYEIPVDKISDIRIGDKEDTLYIMFEEGKMALHSSNIEVLMALRHFLLPFVSA